MSQSTQSDLGQEKSVYLRPSTPLKVHVLPDEKQVIQERAEMCNTSMSSYLKTLGLGHIPKSILDNKAILNLLKVNGDQGRLGGLLKLLLTEQGDHLDAKTQRTEINQLLNEIEETQTQLKEILKSIKLKR